ncbi:NusA-like transcription termination signal-binding factor, partial [Haloarcula sp. JP-Z28]|nr:NusA-like transcription termination signal-binding factor [Haloarcula sp. JP-Z28]
MRVELSDEARRLVALFEDEAAVTVRDCVVDEDHD